MSIRQAVACGHALTAGAAESVLRAGGNAYDAIIAAFFMACVAEPVLAGFGGGGFLLARPASGRAHVYDFFAQTPRNKKSVEDVDFEKVVVDFGAATQDFHVGYGATAVPGAVKGMFDVHRALGSVPLSELTQPAVEAARQGVTVTDLQAYLFSLVEPIYINDAAARKLFGSRIDANRAVGIGETLNFTDLADFIEVLAIEGEDLFYRGEVARLIGAQCESAGHLCRSDLEEYRVEVREPLTVRYRDARVLTNPPPAAGGSLIAFGLHLLSMHDVASTVFGSEPELALRVDVLDIMNGGRSESTDEDGCLNFDLLCDPTFMARYRETLHGRARAYRGTTHISIMDAELNVASMTVSNGEGCGRILPGTGLMLNNMLGEEDLNPAGLQQWPLNRRMSSMMAPTVILEPGKRLAVTGSGGSNRIRSAVLQVLVNLLDHGMDVEQAVTAPRVHVDGDVLYMEGGFASAEVERILRRYPQYKRWEGRNFFFGGAHTLVCSDGRLSGAADPRRGGVVRLI